MGGIIPKERGKRTSVTRALWVPVLWYALATSRSIGRWLYDLKGIGEIHLVEGNPINRVVYGTLIAAGFLALFLRRANWSGMLKVNRWLFLLIFYAAFSILWSGFPGVSIAKWIWMIGYLVMVLVVLTEPNPVEAISALFRRCLYVLLPLSIVLIIYFPEIGIRDEMWVGASTHKNGLGAVAMIGAIYFLWRITVRNGRRRIALDLVFLLMALWLLVGSDSMTSVFVFLIGAFALILMRLFRGSKMSVGTQAFVGVIVMAMFLLMFNLAVDALSQDNLFSITVEKSGHARTFTGRTHMWAEILDLTKKHPILGAGYGGFWVGGMSQDQADLWERLQWTNPAQGHNGYVDVYVDLGIIGLLILASVIVSSLRDTVKTMAVNFEYGTLRAVLLFMVLAGNITESRFLRGTHLWFIFLLAAINVVENLSGENKVLAGRSLCQRRELSKVSESR